MAKHEQVNIQKVLKFSELSPSCFDQRQKSVVLLENVAEFVELNMIIQQRPNGQYELVKKTWMNSNYMQDKDQYFKG